jgi:predicted AAA+ superfamily ATPase
MHPDRLNAPSQMIILDEVQKVPAIFDEVHYLIEETDYQFILCGSSACKLKRMNVNMLGGRAWKFHLYPFVSSELMAAGIFDLYKVLTQGLIPSHYLSDQPKLFFKSYVEDYLIHEIQAEGVVRNLPHFYRFLDSLKFCHGELVNYSNIARDCHVDAKTVKGYFQILVDTLVGYYLPPFHKKQKRDVLQETPKFYLFDVGIANYLKKIEITGLQGIEAGRAFEHFIFLELLAHRAYSMQDYALHFWRTTSGKEVDFILDEGKIAIEVKISAHISKTELSGLMMFQEEYQPKRAIMVCLETTPRIFDAPSGKIEILPYMYFLNLLWSGSLFMT